MENENTIEVKILLMYDEAIKSTVKRRFRKDKVVTTSKGHQLYTTANIPRVVATEGTLLQLSPFAYPQKVISVAYTQQGGIELLLERTSITITEEECKKRGIVSLEILKKAGWRIK